MKPQNETTEPTVDSLKCLRLTREYELTDRMITTISVCVCVCVKLSHTMHTSASHTHPDKLG